MNKSSLLILISALFFLIINEVVSYNIALKEEIEVSYKKDKQILTNLFDAQDEHLSVLAEVLASDISVIESLSTNKPEIIKEHIAPIWEMLQTNKLIYEIHFFKPPAISFVNFSDFTSAGKDISDIRTDIKWVTSSYQESSHVLMCKMYAGYRTAEPIVDSNGTILGALSVGRKVDWVPSAIKEDTSHDSFLVYTEKSSHLLLPKYYKTFMKNKKKFNDLILGNSTLTLSTQELKDVDFKKKVQNITIKGYTYKLFSYPIVDFNKEKIGYLCTVSKLEAFNARFINFSIKEIILILLTAFIFIFINERRNKKVYKYINFLKEMTDKIKRRDFKSLRNKRTVIDDEGSHSLSDIEENIINMGLSLEKQYHVLENENRIKSQQLIEQLYRDELTRYGNRSALLRDLELYPNSRISLLNVRGFKNINDAFGFETGNHILKELANTYKNLLGSEFELYRISNDEFAVINKIEMSEHEFLNSIEKVIKEIGKLSFLCQKMLISLNVYAGINLESKDKLAKVTLALAEAKKNKMNYVIYDKEYDTKVVQTKNIEMTNKISNALKYGNIVPYFQAITDINGKIFKYEALVRMIDNKKVISPFFFLEIAQKTNMYFEITKVVINKTFDKFKDSDKVFSINLTAADILNPEILELIDNKLEHCKDTNKVVFELVESDDLFHLKKIEEFLKKMKSVGVKIAIDDFGTGYSNFAYMIKMRPDYLKIDGSLIKNIDTDKAAYNMVQTIINFAHDLDIRVVAEFIHSKAVFDICKELRVDEFQGYYLGEPQAEIEV